MTNNNEDINPIPLSESISAHRFREFIEYLDSQLSTSILSLEDEQVDLDTEYVEFVNENFWDLV